MIIKTDKDTFTHYLEDASGMLGANAEKLFIPETKEEVSSLLVINIHIFDKFSFS